MPLKYYGELDPIASINASAETIKIDKDKLDADLVAEDDDATFDSVTLNNVEINTALVADGTGKIVSGNTNAVDYYIVGTEYSANSWIKHTQSAGRIYGGEITAVSPANGKVNIAAGVGLVHKTDAALTQDVASDSGWISEMDYVSWDAVSELELTDNAYNFIYYDYATTSIKATTDFYSISATQDFTLGRAYRAGNTVTIRLCGTNLWSFNRRVQLFGEEVFPIKRASGMIVTEVGTRNIAVTASVLWAGLVNRFTTDAVDTSGAGRFTYWHRNGSTWTAVLDQAAISKTQYNDTASGLANFAAGPNHWGVHWVFVVHDSSVHVVYGTADYTTIAAAQAATVPSVLPGLVSSYGTLAARIIIKKDADVFTEIDSAFDTVFVPSAVSSHNDLGGLQGGTAGEYYHLTSAQHTIATQAATGLLAGYVTTSAQTFSGAKTFLSDLVAARITAGSTAETGAAAIYLNALYNGTTQVMDSSRNLSNIGTISSGAITASGLNVDSGTLYVDAANNRVGIGTSSPNATLTIGTSIGTFDGISIGAAANRDLRIGQSATNNVILGWKYNATAGSAYAILETFGGNNTLGIQTSGGNLAIGKTSANAKLDVNGNAIFAGTISSGAITSSGEIVGTKVRATGDIELLNHFTYNAYYSGGFKYRENGSAFTLYKESGDKDFEIKWAANGSAGAAATFVTALTINRNSGNAFFGKDIATTAVIYGGSLATDYSNIAADSDGIYWYVGNGSTARQANIYADMLWNSGDPYLRFVSTGELLRIYPNGNLRVIGDLAVNGGDITSTATTFNLLNATVTTLNIGGAATTIAIGNASGLTTLKGDLYVDGGYVAVDENKIISLSADNDNYAFVLSDAANTWSTGADNTVIASASGTVALVNGDTAAAANLVCGDVAANGGDLTSTQTTFNLLNSTVTTLNIGGAGTAVSIGAGSGTTTIANNIVNPAVVYPSIAVSNAGYDAATFTITVKKYDGNAAASTQYVIHWWWSTTSGGVPAIIANQVVESAYLSTGFDFGTYSDTALNTACTNADGEYKVRVTNNNADNPVNLYLNVEVQGKVYTASAELYDTP